MKKIGFLLFAGLILVWSCAGLDARASRNSMTLNGATGLITLPTAYTSLENGAFGLDIGVHTISDNDGTNIPKIKLTLFNRWEIGAAYDTQVENGEDILIHSKLRFYPWSQNSSAGGTSLAIGGNYQKLQGPQGNNTSVEDRAYQLYLATSYGGNIFSWPSETSFVVGKTFTEQDDSNIDFSMGFNLSFLPSIFKGYINWIMDFGNFSYSLHAYGARTSRGILNTGLRLDLLKGFSNNIHLKIDLLYLDALDENRSWGAGVNFGLNF